MPIAARMDVFFSERFSTYRNFFAVVGALCLIKITFGLLKDLWSGFLAYILAPLRLGGAVDLKKFGSWGVVTGASEGIGRGYALELAKRGLNVVLMSRSREKLDKVAREIRETYHCEALVIPVDFTEGQSVYPTLSDQLKNLDIGVLVNNVGISHKFAQFFLEASSERLREILELNCQTTVQMTHLILPAMVAKGRGAIINISSFVANSPAPFIGVYAATKIFVNYFSAALSKEYASKGILVQTVMPHFVSTAMTKMHRNIFVPPSNVYTKSAVSTIGIQATTFGYFPHVIICRFSQMMPGFIMRRLMWSVLSYARSRYLKIMAQRNAQK